MHRVSRSSLHYAYLATTLIAGTSLLTGCLGNDKQTEMAARDAGEGLSDVERDVIERSQQRWTHLLDGDVESAYEFTSPTYRSMTSLQRFRSQFGTGLEWTDARIQKVECDTNRCRVNVDVTYRVSSSGITHTRSTPETWIRSENEWWIHVLR